MASVIKDRENGAVVLSEDADQYTTEERAVAYFADQKKLYTDKIDRRTAVVAEAKRHDPKDPNIAFDLDYIESTKAIVRGYDDAIVGAMKRGNAQRELVKKPAAPGARE